MSVPSPLDAVRVLLQRLQDGAKELGLELHQAAVIPGPPEDDGTHAPDMLQTMFIISEEAVDPAGVEARKINEQFEEMAKQLQAEEKEAAEKEKLKEIGKSLQEDVADWLKGE